MPATDRDNGYALHPLTLGYRDAAVEAEYQRHQPRTLARSLRPLLLILVPFLALAIVLDVMNLPGLAPVPWYTGAFLIFALFALLFLTWLDRPALIQAGLMVALIVTALTLIIDIETHEQLARYLPGMFILIMITHFVALRFAFAVATVATQIALLMGTIVINDIGARAFFDVCVFLLPGYAIAATAGYMFERQGRRLYAQLKITEQQRNLHEQQALHDPLTELPNRSLLRERMNQSVARAKRHHGQFAVLFVDLDDFKTVNDNYGHAIGDRVLRKIADNLQNHVRSEDTVARLGGDEFVILSEHVNDERGASIAADRIQAAVATPIVIDLSARGDEIHIKVTCSIGISLCPRDGDNLEALLNRADEAMYKAKKSGKHTSRFFEPGEPDSESATG